MTTCLTRMDRLTSRYPDRWTTVRKQAKRKQKKKEKKKKKKKQRARQQGSRSESLPAVPAHHSHGKNQTERARVYRASSPPWKCCFHILRPYQIPQKPCRRRRRLNWRISTISRRSNAGMTSMTTITTTTIFRPQRQNLFEGWEGREILFLLYDVFGSGKPLPSCLHFKPLAGPVFTCFTARILRRTMCLLLNKHEPVFVASRFIFPVPGFRVQNVLLIQAKPTLPQDLLFSLFTYIHFKHNHEYSPITKLTPLTRYSRPKLPHERRGRWVCCYNTARPFTSRPTRRLRSIFPDGAVVRARY